MKLSKPTISFFCPAYNDEKNLPILIPKTVVLLKQLTAKFEIIIIEDGSPDETGSVADGLARKYKGLVKVIHHRKNLGYGAALKRGFREAKRYDYVFFTDGDNQFDVNELQKFIPHLTKFDAVVGYRTNRALSLQRKIQTIVFNLLNRLLFGIKVKDINCSMKIIKRSLMNKIILTSDSSFIEAELFIRLNQHNARIYEVGVTHYPRTFGLASGGNPAVILGTIKDICAFWWELNKNAFTKLAPIILFSFWALFSYLNFFHAPYAVWESGISEAWLFKHGYVLYRDYIHHHTPLLRYILFGYFEVLGYSPRALQLYSFSVVLILAYFIYKSSKSFSSSAGIIGLASFLLLFSGLFGRNFHLEEVTAGVFLAFVLFSFFKFFDTKKSRYLFFGGAALGCAIMTKQSVVGVVAAVGITFALLAMRKYFSLKQLALHFACIAAGVLVIVGPTLLYFFVHTAIDEFFYYNVIFNFTTYPKYHGITPSYEGIRMAVPLILSVLPLTYIVLKREHISQVDFAKIVLLITSILFLIPALLPSFYSVRLLSVFPFALVGWVYVFYSIKNKTLWHRATFMPKVMILIFFLSTSGFVVRFIASLPADFSNRTLLYDYTPDDIRVAEWLKENTAQDQKIYNMGNNYINYLSQRFPQNKYFFMLPWLVMPFEKSTADLMAVPPEIVISDINNEKDPMLKEWRFLDYLQEKYYVKKQFGNMRIYYKK